MNKQTFVFSILSTVFAGGAIALAPATADAACNWTVKGDLKVQHRLTELKQQYGTSALENVEVKVSAKHKVAGVWGTWGSWSTVRTKADGTFSTTESKNCANRRFKVEVKFQDSDLEVRHETATSSTTKVKWYTILEETSGSRSAGTYNIGTKTFMANGAKDLKDDEAWAHADIWFLYKKAIAKAASYGSAYAFTTKIKVKYPHNSWVAGDNVEASYANPTTKVIYIFRSNDGKEDHLNVGTLLHEMGHIWAYNHTSGEICLTETLVTKGNTHGLVGDSCVAFHEGWAEYFSDEMTRALLGGDKQLPYARPKLQSMGLTSQSLVQRHDDGWWSVFHTLSTPKLHNYDFNTATSGRVTLDPTKLMQCQSPNVTFKQVMSVFNAGGSYSSKLSRSETTITSFLDRAAARVSGLSSADASTIKALVNPASTVQARDNMCTEVTATPVPIEPGTINTDPIRRTK